MFHTTISTKWSDERTQTAREHEMYFVVARRGDIRRIRRNLAKRGVELFQRDVYRRHRRWIPKRRIKVAFEREKPAKRAEDVIKVESLTMDYKGRRWKATRHPSRVISYGRRRSMRRHGR